MAKRIQYTARDFENLFEELKTKATELFPDWTDFSESNIGVVLLELFAVIGDMLSYYENRNANESFLSTVRKKINLINLIKLIGYLLKQRTAAIVELKFSIPGILSNNVLIPKDTIVQTLDGNFSFQTIADVQIDAGLLDVTVNAKNWASFQDLFEADASANQIFSFSQINFIEITDIDIDGDLTWIEVEDFLNSGATDKHYKIEFDADLQSNDIARIVFGDGVTGAKPSGEIDVNYKIGGGLEANKIQINKIEDIKNTIYDDDVPPNKITDITVTNEDNPNGGSNSETLEQAKINAPRSVKATERTVAREDFIINSEAVEGVIRAQALSYKQLTSIPLNTTNVYIVPNGGGTPTQTLKDAVTEMLTVTRPTLITHNVFNFDPSYVTVDFVGTFEVLPGYVASEVKIAIDQALTDYFDYENINADTNEYVINFEMEIPVSLLIAIIQNVDGVKEVSLTSPSTDVVCVITEIPELGSLTGLVAS